MAAQQDGLFALKMTITGEGTFHDDDGYKRSKPVSDDQFKQDIGLLHGNEDAGTRGHRW